MPTALQTRTSNTCDAKYAQKLRDILQISSDREIIQARQKSSDYLDKKSAAAETQPKLWSVIQNDIFGLKDDEGNLTIQMISQAGYTIQTALRFQNTMR